MAKIKSKLKKEIIYNFAQVLDEFGFRNDLSKLDIMNFMRFYIDNGYIKTMDKAIKGSLKFFNEYKPKMEEFEY